MGPQRDRTLPAGDLDPSTVAAGPADDGPPDPTPVPAEGEGGDPPCWEGLVEDHRDRPPPPGQERTPRSAREKVPSGRKMMADDVVTGTKVT